jgi:hypothetical protein
MSRYTKTIRTLSVSAFLLFMAATSVSAAGLVLGPEQAVQAGGVDIAVPGFSVPSFVFWDDDGLKDLVVGEGSGMTGFGLVRVYLNSGTPGSPVFTGYFYAQSNSSALQSPGGG